MTAGGIQPDPALPGLSVLLSPDALREELRRRLPECREGLELVDLSSVDLQYEPGRSASLLVKLKLAGASGGTRRPLLYLQALPAGTSPPPVPEATLERYRERQERGGLRQLSPLREPVQSWPELGLHLHVFPVDPLLPTLGDVLDTERMRTALHRAWQPRGVRVRRVSVELLSYTPKHRAALRYQVLSEDRQTGLPELRRLVGKLQRRKPPARLFAGHWAAWREMSGRLSIVPPAGYVATAGLSLQEFLEGERLSDLAGDARFIKHVREAARGIADVHGTSLPLPNVRDAAKECRVVNRWVSVVARLQPALADRVERHGSRLKAELHERYRARGTVHCDFHLANVMVGDDGVTFIDWDQVAHGDPALDPGRFLGALRVAALRVTGEPEGLDEAGETFVDAYLERRGEDDRQLRLFESLALLISSASPFRLQRSGWEEHGRLLFAKSERALERATSTPPLAATPASARPLPLPARRSWSEDRAYSQALLVPVLRQAHGEELEVTECRPRVLAERDDLLHVRWNVKGWLGEKRWRSTVEGVGVTGHTGGALHRRLELVHEALGERSDTVALPRPLGHLDPISLVAQGRVAGTPLVRGLGTDEEARVLERLGAGLGALASLRVELDKKRTATREAQAVGRRVSRLAQAEHPLATRLRELLDEAESRASIADVELAPTPHPLQLSDVHLDGPRAGLRVVRDLVAAPAPAAVAALLSELSSKSLRGDASTDAPERLRAAFCASAQVEPAALAPLEAILLLRRATRRLLAQPADQRAEALLEAAVEALARAAKAA